MAAVALFATAAAADTKPPPAELVQMELIDPPYRATIFSTQPRKRIVVRLTHFDLPLKRVLAKVRVTLWAPAGEPLAEAELDEVGQQADFDACDLAPGRYTVSYGTSAGGTIEQALVVHVLPPSPSEVYLNAEGLCHVNGEPFFPIGLYHVGDNLTMLNQDMAKAGKPALTYAEIVRRVAAKGFNTIVTTSSGEQSLDLAAKYNMRVLQFATMGGGPAERAVREQKAHPALLGWSMNDEPQLDAIVKYKLLERYMQMRTYDPYHPVWVAQHSDFLHGVFTYEVLAAEHYHWDVLTIGNQGRLSVLPGTGARILQARAAVRPGQGVWLITQAAGGALYTVVGPKELRNRIYQGIIAGARGVLTFTYTYGEYMEHGLRWRIDRDAPQLWQACGRINDELRRIMPILLMTGGQYNLEIKGAPGIRYLKREQGGKLHIIAVNTGRNPQRFKLPISGDRTQAKLVLEDRTIALKNGQLEHWIDLFGARVFEIE